MQTNHKKYSLNLFLFVCIYLFFVVSLHRIYALGMQIGDLEQIFALHPEIDVMAKELSKKRKKHFLLSNLFASSRSIILNCLRQRLVQNQHPHPILIVLDNADDAQYMYADLRTLSNDQAVYFFPSSHRRRQQTDEAMLVQRTEVLTALHHATPHYTTPIIVTYPEALADTVPTPETLQQQRIVIHTEEEILQSALIEQLLALQFQRVDFVYEPGQFAVRGGIVDVYSYAHDNPYRIDFFGDEVDSIREFDIETQLSKSRVEVVNIVGANTQEESTYLTSYLSEETLWVSNDFSLVQYKIQGTPLHHATPCYTTIEIGQKSTFSTYDTITFDTLPQPTFNKNFDLLIDDLRFRI